MRAYQPDRVVKLLSGLATGLYYLAWVLVVLAVLAVPVGRLAAPRAYLVEAPVTVHPAPDLTGDWRVQGAQVEVSQVWATASVPVSVLPPGALVLTWLTQVVGAGLILLFLHHLRRLFQRVRQGAPFDEGNAARLRTLGLVLLAAWAWNLVSDVTMSLVLSKLLEGPGNRLGTSVPLDLTVGLVALMLIALAEIFRRGAALEEEQALVV